MTLVKTIDVGHELARKYPSREAERRHIRTMNIDHLRSFVALRNSASGIV